MADITIIKAHCAKLEEASARDICFVLQKDGSGCFEDYHTAEVWQHFENIDALNDIIFSENLKEFKLHE